MQRIEEYNQLLEDSKEVLRKDTTLWKGFLKFAHSLHIINSLIRY